jgi:queuine tRNA-ribosyltransferase
MGVGTAEDFFEAVARGVDMFDCVLPTRLARHGAAFTHTGRLNLRNQSLSEDQSPIEEGCVCYACRHFTRAYIRHLMVSKEILGLYLASFTTCTSCWIRCSRFASRSSMARLKR